MLVFNGHLLNEGEPQNLLDVVNQMDVVSKVESLERESQDNAVSIYRLKTGINDLKNTVEELIVTNKETLSRMSRFQRFKDRKYVGLLKGRIDTLEFLKYLLERLIDTTNR